MSFLNLKKEKKDVPAIKKLVPKEAVLEKLAVAGDTKHSGKKEVRPDVLRQPHVTEKASASAERGAYVFDVSLSANKRDIAKAVSLFYHVTPVKVTVVPIPAKRITVKGRPGFRKGGKKAYVFLKKGEKIEVV